MKSETEKARVTQLDVRLAISAMICYGLAMLLDDVLGVKFHWNGYSMDILQKMTCCISCFLVCQDNTKISFSSGVNRMIITFIGGVVGIVVILLDEAFRIDWLMIPMLGAAVILTLLLCKLAKVPYVNARIGCVTLVLVTCTMASTARIWYGVFRLVSTLFGVIVSLLVTWVFQKLLPQKA